MGVSRSGYYKWKNRDKSGRDINREAMIALVSEIHRTEESYKREILKLRIENERLKKNYAVRKTDAGELEYIRLKPKNSKL